MIKKRLLFLTLFTGLIHAASPGNYRYLADRLGFVSAPNQNLCGGYYIEPILGSDGEPILPVNTSITKINASFAAFTEKKETELSGNVVVIQSGRRLEADRAVSKRNPKTGRVATIDLYGNVKAYEEGKLVVGKHAHLVLNQKAGRIDEVVYRVQLYGESTPLNKNHRKLEGVVAWGQASHVAQLAPGESEYYNATYTTCAPQLNQWMLRADKIKLDRAKERGTARNVWFTYRGIPLVYTPYLTFPTTKKRKTGFLFPIFGVTNSSGAEAGFPFYINAAPNYDATITPIYLSKRDFWLRTKFRYLTPNSRGIVHADVLPEDPEFKSFQQEAATNPQQNNQFGFKDLQNDSDTRYFVSWRDTSRLGSRWQTSADFAEVSDDYYFQDLGSQPEVIATNQLLRQGRADYYGNYWHFDTIVQNYETLNAVNRQPVNTLYSRLPQMDLDGEYPNALGFADVFLHLQGVYFNRSLGATDTVTPVDGGREVAYPGISLPYSWTWGYFTPSVQAQFRRYDLANTVPFQRKTENFAIPIYNVDTGAYLDRSLNLFGRNYQQTLEPRLFYLYVPYQDQTTVPDFDSAFIPFTYNQLFSFNRFSGYDRLGDTNQLSYALTTRLLDNEDGYEKLAFSIGQIGYFRDRRLNICNKNFVNSIYGCNQTETSIGVTSNKESVSPLAMKMVYHFTPIFSLNADTAYDFYDGRMITADSYLQYNPGYNEIFNIGYSYLRNGDIVGVPNGATGNDLNQISFSSAWPIWNNLSAVGIYNYNISKQRSQTFMAGLSYDTCCWQFRAVFGEIYTALNQNNNPVFRNAFYVQWQLKGLGNFGTNSISDILTSQIAGYHDPFALNEKTLLG